MLAKVIETGLFKTKCSVLNAPVPPYTVFPSTRSKCFPFCLPMKGNIETHKMLLKCGSINEIIAGSLDLPNSIRYKQRTKLWIGKKHWPVYKRGDVQRDIAEGRKHISNSLKKENKSFLPF